MRLRVDAVPTIFKVPPYLQKKVRQRRPPKLRGEPADTVQTPSSAPVEGDQVKCPSVRIAPVEAAVPVKVAPVNGVPVNSASVKTVLLEAPPPLDQASGPSTSDEHHYFASPLTLRRLLEDEKSKNAEMHKRLKTEQQARRRLQTKVDSFRQVVDALKKEQLISDFAIAVLERTFSGKPLCWDTIVSHH